MAYELFANQRVGILEVAIAPRTDWGRGERACLRVIGDTYQPVAECDALAGKGAKRSQSSSRLRPPHDRDCGYSTVNVVHIPLA